MQPVEAGDFDDFFFPPFTQSTFTAYLSSFDLYQESFFLVRA